MGYLMRLRRDPTLELREPQRRVTRRLWLGRRRRRFCLCCCHSCLAGRRQALLQWNLSPCPPRCEVGGKDGGLP
jgi:hypothetical protein